MNTFKVLAEVLADKNYFEVSEVEGIIEVYFNLWLSDIRNGEIISDDIIIQRNRILSEKDQLHIKRNVIEKQLFDAKESISQRKEVDKYWMSRANLAFRIVKDQIIRCQNHLTNLSSIERKRNIEISESESRKIKDKVFQLIKEDRGEDFAKELFKKAQSLI